MTTAEERRKILDMVAAGTLDVGEAAALLAAAKESAPEQMAEEAPLVEKEEATDASSRAANGESAGEPPRWLRIRVGDLKSGRRKVSVNVPLGFLKAGLKVGGAFAPELKNMDWGAFAGSLQAGEKGMIVDVEDEEDGEHVQIYVE